MRRRTADGGMADVVAAGKKVKQANPRNTARTNGLGGMRINNRSHQGF